jgi:hypothetical protein
MSGTTGNRCEIYEKIDALDEARTVADLVKRLKPILSELAYYAVTGEAAVMETREEWHSQYADALYGATASDFNADRAAAAAPRAAPARAASARAPAPSGAGRVDPGPARSGKGRGDGGGERRHAQAAPPTNRPRPGDIPPSLQAIMDGSHPSFKEDDDK